MALDQWILPVAVQSHPVAVRCGKIVFHCVQARCTAGDISIGTPRSPGKLRRSMARSMLSEDMLSSSVDSMRRAMQQIAI